MSEDRSLRGIELVHRQLALSVEKKKNKGLRVGKRREEVKPKRKCVSAGRVVADAENVLALFS